MRGVIRQSTLILKRRNVPESENSIKILLEESFGRNQAFSVARLRKFKCLVQLRSVHFPIQYLCRSWPFRCLNLKLEVGILVPRFESQYMIQILSERIRKKYSDIEKRNFIQFGCGSGALGLSLAKQLDISGVMVDIEAKCIQIAQKNAKLNKVETKIGLVKGDMLDYLSEMVKFDIVISNPPYLSEEHFQKFLKCQVKRFQRKTALVAQEEGIKFIREISDFWLQNAKKGILMLQFDGRDLKPQLPHLEKYVLNDQYGKRRFILIQK